MHYFTVYLHASHKRISTFKQQRSRCTYTWDRNKKCHHFVLKSISLSSCKNRHILYKKTNTCSWPGSLDTIERKRRIVGSSWLCVTHTAMFPYKFLLSYSSYYHFLNLSVFKTQRMTKVSGLVPQTFQRKVVGSGFITTVTSQTLHTLSGVRPSLTTEMMQNIVWQL